MWRRGSLASLSLMSSPGCDRLCCPLPGLTACVTQWPRLSPTPGSTGRRGCPPAGTTSRTGRSLRAVLGALAGVGEAIGRAQLRHPLAQHRHAPLPADAFGDDAGRHVGGVPQQPADLLLDRVDGRARSIASVCRRALRAHRLSHGVADHAQPRGDGLDAQLLREMKPAGLRPLFHVVHVLPPELAARRGRAQVRCLTTEGGGPFGEGGQFSTVDTGQYSAVGDTCARQNRARRRPRLDPGEVRGTVPSGGAEPTLARVELDASASLSGTA